MSNIICVYRLGASLFVDNPISITNLLYNPLCFLLHEDITLPPDQWHNVSLELFSVSSIVAVSALSAQITIISTRNSAIEGSTLYIRQLDACGWISFHPPFFNLTSIRDWPIWDIRYHIMACDQKVCRLIWHFIILCFNIDTTITLDSKAI